MEKPIYPTLSHPGSANRNELFDRYIMPQRDFIHSLCKHYSFREEHVEENYADALTNLYRGIDTYDPNRPLTTWIHIVTKRYVLRMERQRQAKGAAFQSYASVEEVDGALDISDRQTAQAIEAVDWEHCKEVYSDEVLRALQQLPAIFRDAILLQGAGYSVREIAEIAHSRGTLPSKNTETIKSRLFLARKKLKLYLNPDGTKRNPTQLPANL